MSVRCVECGRIHCEECSERYALLTWLIRIERYWKASDGVSHIITQARDDKFKRVLCSGDVFETAERMGYVPVQYGVMVPQEKASQ